MPAEPVTSMAEGPAVHVPRRLRLESAPGAMLVVPGLASGARDAAMGDADPETPGDSIG
jgi:hypothetical protein